MRRRGVTRQYSSLLAVPLLLPILQNRGRETNHGLAESSWKTISTTSPKLKSTFIAVTRRNLHPPRFRHDRGFCPKQLRERLRAHSEKWLLKSKANLFCRSWRILSLG